MYEENTPNVRYIVRIRSPGTKDDKSKVETMDVKLINTKTGVKTLPKTPVKNNKSPILKDNINYTIFTSSEPGKTLAISNKPIAGRLINQTIISESDITDYSHNIIKDANIMEFDRIYNETQRLDMLYNDEIKDCISNSIQGFNSCIILCGPNNAGKSYTLRGEEHHEGILGKSVKDLFSLMEISQQVNTGNTVKSLYGLKMSIYTVFNECIYDLVKKNSSTPLQISKFIDKDTGTYFTKINDLSEAEIKNYNEYNNLVNHSLQHRKILETTLKVNDFKKKSNLIVSFILSKKEISAESNSTTFEKSQNIAQIDFVELTSTDYGLDLNTDKSDYFGKTTATNFRSIKNNLESLAVRKKPRYESNLTLALKRTLNPTSQIVFINCVHSNEEPPTESYKALKFATQLRNSILNTTDNIAETKQSFNTAENEQYNTNNNKNTNNINTNNRLNNYKNINQRITNNESPQNNDSLRNERNDTYFNQNNYKSNERNENFERQEKNKFDTRETEENFNQNNNISNNHYKKVNIPQGQSRQTGNEGNSKSNRNTSEPRSISPNNVNINVNNNSKNNINDVKKSNKSINQNSNIDYLSDYQSDDEMKKAYLQRPKYTFYNKQNNPDNNNYILTQKNATINQEDNQKKTDLEKSIQEIENRNEEINKNLENLRMDRSRLEDKSFINPTNMSYQGDFDRIKHDNNILKSDNIMFKDELNMMNELNRRLDIDLSQQRMRNLELAAEVEKASQDKIQKIQEIDRLNDIISQYKIQESTYGEKFQQKFMNDNKVKEAESELKKCREEKQKYEVESRILEEKYTDLRKTHEVMEKDYNFLKNKQNEEIINFEGRLEKMTRELETLQRENNNLRNNEIRIRQELSNFETQRDNYRDKYQETKLKNNQMSTKMTEIEEEVKQLMHERITETYESKRFEDSKKNNFDKKQKIIKEMQERVHQYKNEILKSREKRSKEF